MFPDFFQLVFSLVHVYTFLKRPTLVESLRAHVQSEAEAYKLSTATVQHEWHKGELSTPGPYNCTTVSAHDDVRDRQ